MVGFAWSTFFLLCSVAILMTYFIEIPLLLYFLGMSLYMSRAYSIHLNFPEWTGLLGKLSGYVFIFHWIIGKVIVLYLSDAIIVVKIALYFVISFCVSYIAMSIHEKLAK